MGYTFGVKLPKTGGSPMWTAHRDAGAWGEYAESLGYDSLWTSESWGSEAFVELADIVGRTDTLTVGTAIANVYSRSPAVLAMAAATLSRRSDGRAILGVGASHPGLVEDVHGIEYHRPVRRTHETIDFVRSVLGDDSPVRYEGELIQTASVGPLSEPVPIYNAALGTSNRRATGRVADGWIPYLFPFSRLDDAYETIAAAAKEAGRDPDTITVIPQVLAVVDDDPAVASRPIREYVARYVGHYDAYRAILAESFPSAVESVADAWRSGDEDAAVEHVPDELVAEVGVAGPAAAARSGLRSILEIDAVDEAIVYVPNGQPLPVFERTFEALRPSALD